MSNNTLPTDSELNVLARDLFIAGWADRPNEAQIEDMASIKLWLTNGAYSSYDRSNLYESFVVWTEEGMDAKVPDSLVAAMPVPPSPHDLDSLARDLYVLIYWVQPQPQDAELDRLREWLDNNTGEIDQLHPLGILRDMLEEENDQAVA